LTLSSAVNGKLNRTLICERRCRHC